MIMVKRIQFFFKFIVLGFLLAVIFHYSAHQFFYLDYPWNSPFVESSDRFNDWYNSVFSASTMDPYYKYGAATSAYFPFSYILLRIAVYANKYMSLLIYFCISAVLMGLGIGLFIQLKFTPVIKKVKIKLKCNSLILLICSICLSYPLIFALDRANLDVWVAGLVMIYVATFRSKYYVWGLISLSIAISMKGYPLAFLLLTIADRKYWLSMWTIFVAIGLTVLSLLYFNGGFIHNLTGWMNGLKSYNELYVFGFSSIYYSADPYNGLRYILSSLLNRLLNNDERYLLLSIYNIVSFIFAILCVIFILCTNVMLWRKVMAVCLLAILFPNIAIHYKLLLLLPGLFYLFIEGEDGKNLNDSIKGISVLMVSKSYFYFTGISIGSAINPIIMLFLIYSVFQIEMTWRGQFDFWIATFKSQLRKSITVTAINQLYRKY